MAYLGMGDVTAEDFVTVNGICKPRNFATLDKFKALQTQLNRAAQARSLPKIAVDGDIGPGTVKLATAALGLSSASCASIATTAEALTVSAQVLATGAGVPAKVASPAPARPPAIVAPTGQIVPQPASASIMDAFGRMSTTQMVVAAVALGGGAYLLLGKKRRK